MESYRILKWKNIPNAFLCLQNVQVIDPRKILTLVLLMKRVIYGNRKIQNVVFSVHSYVDILRHGFCINVLASYCLCRHIFRKQTCICHGHRCMWLRCGYICTCLYHEWDRSYTFVAHLSKRITSRSRHHLFWSAMWLLDGNWFHFIFNSQIKITYFEIIPRFCIV